MKMSILCHIKDPCLHHTLKEGDDFYCTFDWGGGQRKFTVQHSRPFGSITSPPFLVFSSTPLRSRCAVSVKLPFNGIYQSQRARNLEKQPGLDLQYLGELCSIGLPSSPSTAAIWQESLKAHYWHRDKAGEKNAPQIILKSQETSSSAYIRLTGV